MHDAISAAWQLAALVTALCVIHASAPVQVNQKTLTYVDPSRLAANQGKRQALGMRLLAWLPLCAAPAGNIQLCPVSWSHVWTVRSQSWYSRPDAAVFSQTGKSHELQLRREADAAEPQKLAKRKHQINSLFHAAKLKASRAAPLLPVC